jgi:threonine/homoserine/homoserine lactone efflux protein
LKLLQNIFVGFLVSFIGSIPLGYLNIVGFELYQKSGVDSVYSYLFGVIAVELFVIYFTLIFAQKLSSNKKLLKAIEVFSIFFMLILALVFWFHSKGDSQSHHYLSRYSGKSSFMIGVLLNSVNFVQLPFWIGWNLYLVNAKYIFMDKALKYFYIIGTLAGTFFGMLAFILSLNLVAQKSDSLSSWLMSYVIPLFFIGFAVFQAWKFYKKYYGASVVKK